MSHQTLTGEPSVPAIDIHRLARAKDPGLATEFHRWPLPDYIWPALERCYRSSYCTESQLRISGSLTPRIEAWVARRDGCISAVILFDRYHDHVHVLNEVFVLSEQVLGDFAEAVFGLYPKLHVIHLRAVKIDALPKQYIGLSADISDDYRLKLPASTEQWYRSLSARTREKLRYYLRRAQQRMPTFSFRTLGTNEFNLAQIKKIIQFNRARMQVKGKRFGMSAMEEHQICQIMLERGQLSHLRKYSCFEICPHSYSGRATWWRMRWRQRVHGCGASVSLDLNQFAKGILCSSTHARLATAKH
jgi:hypothetical protein